MYAQVLSDEQKRKMYDQSGFSEFTSPEGAYGGGSCACACHDGDILVN